MITTEYDCSDFTWKMEDYIEKSGKVPSEAVNKKTMDACYWSTKETFATTKEQIERDRMAPSRINPNAPVQAILSNTKRLNPNWKPVNPRANPGRMDAIVQRGINKAKRSANFVKAGWKKAGDKMRQAVKDLEGIPATDSNIRARGDGLGRAQPAFNNDAGIVEATATNAVHGKTHDPKIQDVARQGADKGVTHVLQDIDIYLERKNKKPLEEAGFPTS
jgi:hypothetical protein